MDRQLDKHLQRIVDSANGDNIQASTSKAGLNLSNSGTGRGVGIGLLSMPQQPTMHRGFEAGATPDNTMQQLTMYRGFGRTSGDTDQQSTTLEPSRISDNTAQQLTTHHELDWISDKTIQQNAMDGGLGRVFNDTTKQSIFNALGGNSNNTTLQSTHDHSGPILENTTPQYQSSYESVSRPGSHRLSLEPRNTYNEPKTITNADNHFKFAQNLRQGLPLNHPPSRTQPPRLDAPRLEASQLDSPHLDASRLESIHRETSRFGPPRLGVPRPEASHMDASHLNVSHLDTPRLGPPPVDAPRLDALRLGASRLRASHQNHIDSHHREHLDSLHTEALRVGPPRVGPLRLNPPSLPASHQNHLDSPHLKHLDSLHAEAPRVGPPRVGPLRFDPPRLDSSRLNTPHLDAPRLADTMDNLIDSMLWQGSAPTSRPELGSTLHSESRREANPSGFIQGRVSDSLGQRQNQRHQITPPFNHNGLTYSPTKQQEYESSSPLTGSASSPTARIILRRASHASIVPTEHTGKYLSNKYDSPESNAPAFRQPSHPSARDLQHTLAIPKGHSEGSNTKNSFPELNVDLNKYTPRTLALDHAPPMIQGIPIVSPHELPDRFRHVFPYELFNAVQSKCFRPIYKSNDNIVVSAPTGSGKTVLLELAICRLAESHPAGNFKIVYQAPTKSLCSERLRDWEKKFSHLNLPCAELTGDTNQGEMARVRNATIIVTTPEKWDSITRKWSDHIKLVEIVKLVLIDEVHMLKETRGATLEAVVSRMKSMGTEVRIIAISATVPNAADIARWLGKDHTNQHLPAHREGFDENYRPVKLVKWVHGFDGHMNDWAFDKTLDGKLPGIIQRYSEKKPIMVFCLTKKSCEGSARILSEHWSRQLPKDRAWPAPTKKTVVGNKELQGFVSCGVAFHHAGLDSQDRHAIETAYLKGDISAICCTSTLAVGVNLPCHLVILKGTVGYQDGGKLCEYSDLDVMQMLGRAGRPQFDSKAVAVILTQSDKVKRFEKMISGQQILESTLHQNLIGHLNSEISLGTVNDLNQAKQWIHGTFLAVRIKQNPDHYKMDGVIGGRNVDKRLELVCERDIRLLQEHNLLTTGERFSCTEYGHAMSRYMVEFDTMKDILSMPRQANAGQILQTLSQAVEFKDLRMKPAERKLLRDLNSNPFIKFPIKENITSVPHKISLMIQIQLGGIELKDTEYEGNRRQFVIETTIIFERLQRLIRCIIDCKASDCDSITVRHALDLARCFSAKFWETSNLQLRQIPGVGPALHGKLIAGNINTVYKLVDIDTGTIERIASRAPPFGSKTKDLLANFPHLTLAADITGQVAIKKGQYPKVHVKAQLGYSNIKVPVWDGKKPSITFMAETTDGTLVHFWRGNVMRLEKKLEIKFTVELPGPAEMIKCWMACEEIVGTVKTCLLQPNIAASAFPPPPSKLAFNHPRDTLDEFGDDEFADDDMLAAAKNVEIAHQRSPDSKPSIAKMIEATSYLHDSDDFADIDDLENKAKVTKPTGNGKRKNPSEDLEGIGSVKMANGKWTCRHACADGALLKNGKTCTHKCCKEGKDKPWKFKKTSKDLPDSDEETPPAKKIKSSQVSSEVKLRHEPLDAQQISDAELVDLVDLPSTIPYEQAAPTEYRKLHKLHTMVQGESNIRIPKLTPQFSYASGENPELPFLQQHEDSQQAFDAPDDDYLVPFESHAGLHSDPRNFENAFYDEPVGDENEPKASSAFDGSLNSFEAETMEFLTTEASAPPARNAGNSFSAGVFDFDAYDSYEFEGMDGASQMLPDLAATGQYQGGPSSSASYPESQAHNQHLSDAALATPESQLPGWTNDFDPGMINELRNYVDFEE